MLKSIVFHDIFVLILNLYRIIIDIIIYND